MARATRPEMHPTALIADDDDAARGLLVQALRSAWPELGTVVEAGNGADAWDLFLEHEPSCAFLDVRMPGMTGIEVAQRIGAACPVVFMSVPGDRAIDTLDAVHADILRKPVEPAALEVALGHVREWLEHPEDSHPAPLDGLGPQLRRRAPLHELHAGSGALARSVRVEDVVYLESDARCTRVVADDGELLLRTPLKELLAQLDASMFCQIHRAVVVNRRRIAAAQPVGEADMVLTLRGRDERLPVGRHFQPLFRPPAATR